MPARVSGCHPGAAPNEGPDGTSGGPPDSAPGRWGLTGVTHLI